MEIAKCVRNIFKNKTGGSDEIVEKLLKYGGFGMVHLLKQLLLVIYIYIWQDIVPRNAERVLLLII